MARLVDAIDDRNRGLRADDGFVNALRTTMSSPGRNEETGTIEPVATVLVVDDEPIVREVVVRYLEREGFATVEADDGDGRATLAEEHARPGRARHHAAGHRRARARPLDPRTLEPPVIMLTARGAEDDRIVGLDLGADDYVTKPFSPRELVARVRTVLRRRRRGLARASASRSATSSSTPRSAKCAAAARSCA